jgi:hypothetical protein
MHTKYTVLTFCYVAGIIISCWTLLWLSGPGNFCLVHVSLVPVLNVVGEQVPHC